MKNTVFILVVILSTSLRGQIVLDSLPITNLNYITAAYELPNKNYFVAGTATDFSQDWGYIGVLKNGAYLWQKQVKGWIRGSVQQLSFNPLDSTLLAVYSKEDTAEFNIGFMKLRVDGTVLWDKFYGFGFNSSYPSRVHESSSQLTFGYNIIGFGTRYSRLCVADSLGDTIKSFLPAALQQDSSATIVSYIELPNGNKVVAYNKVVPNGSFAKGSLVFCDNNWNVIRSSGIGSGNFSFVTAGKNAIYVAAKYMTGNNLGASLIQAFDFSGNKKWAATDTGFVCMPQQILELKNGSIAFLLGGNSLGNARSKLLVYSQNGTLINSTSYPSYVCRNVSENYAGQLVMAASKYSGGTFNRTVILGQKLSSASASVADAYAYPNPATNMLSIALPESFQNSAGTYAIYTISGLALAKQGFTSGLYQINVSAIEDGSYFLVIENESGDRAVLRFMK